jgi:hypothetical protein
MHLITRSLLLLAVSAALLCAASGSALAATATVTPSGNGVSGNGTSAWELTIDAQGGGTSARFNCTNGSFNAKLASATGALPLTLSTNYQQTFSGCRTAGVSYTFSCTPTAILQATGLTAAGVTPLSLSGLNCTAAIGGCGSARITGSLAETFNNAGSLLTVPTTGQAITVSGSTCSLIPNGTATFAAAGGGAFTYVVTPTTTITVV